VPVFDLGALPGAVPSALGNGAALAAPDHALPGPDASLAHTSSLDADPDVYNNMKAPNNCVGVCDAPPFSGSPWAVPAPSHWYATVPSGAEGMAPAKALVLAAPVVVAADPGLAEETVEFGPPRKPQSEEIPEVGPQPKALALPLGLCSVHTVGKAGNPMLAVLERLWKEPQSEHAQEEANADRHPSVKPTPGHAVMCGNAVLLGFSTSLWASCNKAWQGEAVDSSDFARDFKESSTANAEAVTPLGGHWLRHHVLKPELGPAPGLETQF